MIYEFKFLVDGLENEEDSDDLLADLIYTIEDYGCEIVLGVVIPVEED
jgi:hypothetical protein